MKADRRAIKRLTPIVQIAYYLGAVRYKEIKRIDWSNPKVRQGTEVRFEVKFRWWHPVYWLIVIFGCLYAFILMLSDLDWSEVYPTIKDEYWIEKEDGENEQKQKEVDL